MDPCVAKISRSSMKINPLIIIILAHLVLVLFLVSGVSATDNESGRDLTSSIVGGQPADDGEYPSYAISTAAFLCGASLIHPDILITAAHCELAFVTPTFFYGRGSVYIGGNKLDGSDAVETIVVETKRQHPNYRRLTIINKDNAITFIYDFMLLKLETPSSSPVVQWNTDPTVPADGDTFTAIGFGSTQDVGGPLSPDLLEVDVQVVDFNTCNAAYTDLGLNLDDATMICAAEDGKGTCRGDGGGPLFDAEGNLVGISSWSNGCAQPGFPGIFSRVSSADDFIRTGICEMSDSPPDYCSEIPPSGICDSCAGLFFTGDQLHKVKRNGRCDEICTAGAFVLVWKLFGWECGHCPA